MEVKVIFQGFPGKMTRGYMSWSSVVYVESANKKLVYDTGGFVERSELPVRFEKFGIDLNDIDILVLSHFHHDHVINFDYFPNARILMHEKEVQWLKTKPSDWAVPNYLFPAVQQTGRLEIVSEDREILPGVSTLLSPGHTPGLMALVLDEKDKTTVIAGDAVKNVKEFISGKVDMSLDNTASANSIKKIREIGDIVIPGHDRVIEVNGEQIRTITSCCERIMVPEGVVQPGRSKQFDLQIEPSDFRT